MLGNFKVKGGYICLDLGRFLERGFQVGAFSQDGFKVEFGQFKIVERKCGFQRVCDCLLVGSYQVYLILFAVLGKSEEGSFCGIESG